MAKLAGRYQILRELGRGGFGVTYLAEDHHQPSRPKCVVKQLKPQPPPPPELLPKIRELFEQEAKALERLGKHDQIPQLLAHFEEMGDFYIVQEFIEGQTLRAELDATPLLAEKTVIKLLKDGLEVLSFVHRQGVIHRDIKPENLIRRQDGRLCLIDFGAVKAFATTALPQTRRLTTTVSIGTAGYMPDEQRRGKPLPASDVYALGMVAIEALTSKSPLDLSTDPDTGEVMWRKWVRVDDNLAEVVTQMVRHHYSRRYQDAPIALRKFQQALETGPASSTSFTWQPGQGFVAKPSSAPPSKQPPQPPLPTPVAVPQAVTNKNRRRVLQWLGSGALAAGGAVAWERQGLLARFWNESPAPTSAPTPTPTPAPNPAAAPTPEPTPEPTVVEVAEEPETTAPSTADRLEVFEFASAKVDDQGNIIETPRGQTQRFIETSLELEEGVNPLEMVLIPAGEFDMGSPAGEEGRRNDEGPQRRVTVPEFMMGKYAVTQAQYRAVMNDLPSFRYFEGADLPVENVPWNDAVDFCDRLSRMAQHTEAPYRLPSEAEWEYACRAGTTTPFAFGTTITTDLANYNGRRKPYGQRLEGRDEDRDTTTDVGSFPANGFGLHDMHGNVWEWCQDTWHDSYEGAPTDGSAWVEGGSDLRLLRGGSWVNIALFCRSAVRGNILSGGSTLGFRVVRAVART